MYSTPAAALGGEYTPTSKNKRALSTPTPTSTRRRRRTKAWLFLRWGVYCPHMLCVVVNAGCTTKEKYRTTKEKYRKGVTNDRLRALAEPEARPPGI
jgi:hypothetical protein